MTKIFWQCSSELKLLAGEWAAYFAISSYNQKGADWEEFAPNLSDAAMFETCQMNESSHVIFGDAYQFLESAGVIKRAPPHYVANCKYSEISQMISANILNVGSMLDYSFFNLPGNWLGYFGKSERDFVTIAQKCMPLFDKMNSEGFCRQVDNRYYWTSKIRPMLELYGQWVSLDYTTASAEEKLMDSLSPELKDKLHNLAITNQKVMACKIMRDEMGLSITVSKPFLENYMFPKIWGKSEEKPPIVRKWFGP